MPEEIPEIFPAAGGSYVRDPLTGELTRVTEPTADEAGTPPQPEE